jgi:hypothetical protein
MGRGGDVLESKNTTLTRRRSFWDWRLPPAYVDQRRIGAGTFENRHDASESAALVHHGDSGEPHDPEIERG